MNYYDVQTNLNNTFKQFHKKKNEFNILTRDIEMNLEHLQDLYHDGYIYPEYSENEKAYVVVIASHMQSFRKVFSHLLDDFDAVLKNIKTGRKVVLNGDPNQNLVPYIEIASTFSPDHEELNKKHRKSEFARLNKGADRIILQTASETIGFISLLIVRKELVKKKYKSDREDSENNKEVIEKFMEMAINNKLKSNHHEIFVNEEDL